MFKLIVWALNELSTTKLYNVSWSITFILVVSPSEVVYKIWISNLRNSNVVYLDKMISNQKVVHYGTSLLESSVWLYNICNTSRLYCWSLPKAPHKPFRDRRKQKKAKHYYALVRIYTPLSDLRVPFEEYKVNYVFLKKKTFKTPSC